MREEIEKLDSIPKDILPEIASPEAIEPIKEKDSHDYTIFKTSYWYGRTLIQMFVNYNFGGYESFGFLIKKANTTLIYNLRKDEKIKLAKAILDQLNSEERKQLGIN